MWYMHTNKHTERLADQGRRARERARRSILRKKIRFTDWGESRTIRFTEENPIYGLGRSVLRKKIRFTDWNDPFYG